MHRLSSALVVGLSVIALTSVGGADPQGGLSGSWKLTLLARERPTIFLLKFESKGNQWTGKVVDAIERMPTTTLEDLKVTAERIRFGLKMTGGGFSFDGKIRKPPAKTILGSIDLGAQMIPAELESTQMTSLKDSYQAAKEFLAREPDSPEAFDAAIVMMQHATAKKATLEDVRGWASRAFKNADVYGPRWQLETGVRIAEALGGQEVFAPVAVEYGRRTERLLEPADEASAHVRTLQALAHALKKTGKTDEAQEVQARAEKWEIKLDHEYLKKVPPLRAETFRGRRQTGDRAVLVELFTGAQCGPCVAADRAFDALEKTYKTFEVVLLEYHVHVPAPDPLANADAEARMNYYRAEGVPTICFNGKPDAPGGGPINNSEKKYAEYRKIIEPLLETPGKAKLKASAVRKGDKIDIIAEVADVEKPGEAVRLRLALVEERVRYQGGNQMRFHHHVVRALPGGPNGLAVKGASAKHSVSMDVGELRQTLNRYLNDTVKEQEFSDSKRPMDLKQLSVVAFLQNDETKDVLQVTQAAVGEEASRR
jgi:hypothetical protein